MKVRPLIAALLITSAVPSTALAVPVEKRDYVQGDPANLPCAIRVEFARSAKGPDYDAWDAIRAYIADSKDIQRAEAWGWRIDGEFILCLQIEEPEATTTVFADLLKFVPKTPANGIGPTTVVLGKQAAK